MHSFFFFFFLSPPPPSVFLMTSHDWLGILVNGRSSPYLTPKFVRFYLSVVRFTTNLYTVTETDSWVWRRTFKSSYKKVYLFFPDVTTEAFGHFRRPIRKRILMILEMKNYAAKRNPIWLTGVAGLSPDKLKEYTLETREILRSTNTATHTQMYYFICRFLLPLLFHHGTKNVQTSLETYDGGIPM